MESFLLSDFFLYLHRLDFAFFASLLLLASCVVGLLRAVRSIATASNDTVTQFHVADESGSINLCVRTFFFSSPPSPHIAIHPWLSPHFT